MSAASVDLEEVSCGLCGSSRSRVLFDRPYESDPLPEGSLAATTDEFRAYGRVVRCLDCRFVYTNPRPRPEALLAGYGSCEDATYLDESSSRSINAHLSLNTIKRFVPSGRLLEVGAFTGHFLNAARTDFEVAGVEPSAWACGVAKKRFGLELEPRSFEATKRFAPGSMDVVAMVDVIEHVTDPRRTLARAAEVLRTGGLLYLVTPDIGSFSALALGPYWWGLRPAHIQYFERATLRRALEEAGFEPALEKSFGRIFSYGYWLSRLRNYPAFVYGAVRGAIRLLDCERKLLYLDTRDSVEVCARKR